MLDCRCAVSLEDLLPSQCTKIELRILFQFCFHPLFRTSTRHCRSENSFHLSVRSSFLELFLWWPSLPLYFLFFPYLMPARWIFSPLDFRLHTLCCLCAISPPSCFHSDFWGKSFCYFLTSCLSWLLMPRCPVSNSFRTPSSSSFERCPV